MTQLTQDMVVTKYCNLSADEDEAKLGRTKKFKIELVIPKGTTITDLANSALATSVIKWQNGNRKKYDKLVNNSTHRITYKRPVSEVDPMTQLITDAKLAGIDPTDQDAMTVYIMEQIAKRS